ncbi:MAG: OadG family transporter subunit [Eubacteriales bacterium]|nr:OadG family transporter subunit [Eubacteriales bacterium]
MKDKIKRILLACMLVLGITVLAGCQAAEETETLDPSIEMQLEQQAEAFAQQIIGFDDEQIDEMIEEFNLDQETVYSAGLNAWKSVKKDLGAYVATEGSETEKLDDGGYRTTLDMQFEKRNCEFVLAIDRKMAEVTEINFTAEYSLGEIMSQAAGNLVVGMGTVFVVLTLIMFVIAAFKFIPQDLGQKKEKQPAAPAAPAPAAAPAAVPAADSNEIEAVIAAAIAAYEADCGRPAGETLANGLVVRSIRRVSKRG